MEMKCMKTKRILSAAMALLLAVSLPMTALAEEYDLAKGSIEVTAKEDGNQYVSQTANNIKDEPQTTATVIIQTDSSTTATQHTVTITAKDKQTAEVTLKDVNIDVSGTGGALVSGSAAVSTDGAGNVTIELEGENTVRSGYNRAGVEKNNTGSLTITDANNDSGSLDATGGEYGAGIGGGFQSSGSDITISGSKVKAMGGQYAAGIGGGMWSSGSNITITDAEVNATGNFGGAGIGGGAYGDGRNITLSDSDVTAKGGSGGAGIGGGVGYTTLGSGNGSDITISGGTTKAAGGEYGAGIGGGALGNASNITVSDDAQVKVQGGIADDNGLGAGAPIGYGGGHNGSVGAEAAPDVSELTTEGKIEYYEPGADMKTAEPTKIIHGGEHEWDDGVETKAPTCSETGVKTYTCKLGDNVTKTEDIAKLPHTVVTDEAVAPTYTHTGLTEGSHCSVCHETIVAQEIVPMLEKSAEAPLYRVKDADGRGVTCKAERKDGVLTITVDADFATLTGKLSGLSTLKAQVVKTIVFVTKGARSTFALADLLEKGRSGETYDLTHDGNIVTFTLGKNMTDVSGILKKE